MQEAMRTLERRDWWTAALFFAAGLAGFAATRTRVPYLWDSVEFALGVEEFSVLLSQPHAPGYFLYVMLGRLVNGWVGDPHASLVWMSVVAGAGLVAAMSLVGTMMFGRTTGVVAGLLTLTSPMVWFYSSVALTYVVDAVLVVILVGWCWRSREREVPWGWVIAVAALWGLLGGLRQQSVPGMAVLVGVTLWGAREGRWMKMGVALAVFGVVTAVWMMAMLAMVGGWEAYWRPLEAITRFHASKTLAGGGIAAAGWNFFFAGLYSFNGLWLATAAVLGAMTRWRGEFSDGRRMILLWCVPVFLLGTLVGYTEAPGHVFTYLPGLILLAASYLGGIARRTVRLGLVGAICLVNVAVFFGWPSKWDNLLWSTVRTRRELAEHDQQLCQTAAVIREHFRPNETILCHRHGDLLYGIRHFQWVLPEYVQVRLDPDQATVRPAGRDLMLTHGRRTEFVSRVDFDQYRIAVFVVPRHLERVWAEQQLVIQEMAQRIVGEKVDLYWKSVQ
jgi:hypothetical protein